MTEYREKRKGQGDPAGDAMERLQCRGCLPDCPDYGICEGRPWRQQAREADGGSGLAVEFPYAT